METFNLRLLQYTYPVLLWGLVALFTLMACRNVVDSKWTPDQPLSVPTAPSMQELPADAHARVAWGG